MPQNLHVFIQCSYKLSPIKPGFRSTYNVGLLGGTIKPYLDSLFCAALFRNYIYHITL